MIRRDKRVLEAVPPFVAQTVARVTTLSVEHPAIAYLEGLFDENDFIFFQLIHSTRTFTNKDGTPLAETKLMALVSVKDATTPKYIAELEKFQEAGWNVYVCMNPFPPATTTRTERLITTIRNLFLDVDKDKGEGANALRLIQEAVVVGLIPAPTSILESSPGNYHIAWAVDGFSWDEAKAALPALISQFGGDTAAKDLNRVLRLPGFKNLKKEHNGFVCELVANTFGETPYTKDQFKIPMVVVKSKTTTPAATEELETIATYIEKNAEEAHFELESRADYQNGFSWEIECPWAMSHTQGGSSAMIMLLADGRPQFNCFHGHCSERGWSDIRQLWEKTVGHFQRFGDPIETNVTCGADKHVAGSVAASESSTDSTEWGDPLPFDNSLSPVQTFQLDFLPRSLQGWAKDVAERTNVPLDFTGICTLVTLAGVTNRRVFIYPKQLDKEWREALAISGAVVAPSGKLKTPTWKAFTNILVEREYDWKKEYAIVAEKYEIDLEMQEKARKAAEKSKAPFEDLVALLEPLPPRRLMVNDTTPEMMHTLMSQNPEGLMVYRDELASWVAELDKEGREVQRGMTLAAMNGNDPYTIDRIGRGSVAAIMSASLFGGFQPELLVEFLNDTRNISDGLIPRFGLMVWPDAVPGVRIDRPADSAAKERFRKVIRTIGEMKAESIALHFDGPAQSRFNDWYDALDRDVAAETHPGRQSHLSKYRGLLTKLAGLLQLADLVAEAPELKITVKENMTIQTGGVTGNHLVDLPHLEQAIALIAYLRTHMNRVYGCLQNDIQRAEGSMAKHILDGDLEDGFTVRDVARKCWVGLPDTEAVKETLEEFEYKNWIRAMEPPKDAKKGRPVVRWKINPKLAK